MLLAAHAPPPAMIEKAPHQQALADLLRMTAEGLEENRVALSDFMRQTWPLVESNAFIPSWHIDCIAEHVQAALDGEIRRLVINGPPRLGKSLPVSVFAPAWDWTRRPQRRFIAASYSQDLATKHNVDRRTIIDSDYYRQRWGDLVSFTADQNLKREFVNTARGHMVARGTGAGITGYGADVIIIDDPLNPELAESEAERKAVRAYYDRTLYSRLDNKKIGTIILVEQRLHAKDLTSHLLAQKHEGWTHLNLPAEAPEKKVYIFPVTKREVTVETGDALCPEREDKAVLAKTKITVGSRRYASQYMQKPSEEEGNILKRSLWKYWRTMPRDIEEYVQSWDMSFKDLQDSDFVVGQVWGIREGDAYLLDQVRGRLNFTATLDAFETMTQKWPKAARKLVEDKANGTAAENVLKKKIGGIILVNPSGGKIARAYAAQPFQEAGNLWVPDPEVHPWAEDFLSETAAFPDGDNDDQVDAATQFVNFRFAAVAKPTLRAI